MKSTELVFRAQGSDEITPLREVPADSWTAFTDYSTGHCRVYKVITSEDGRLTAVFSSDRASINPEILDSHTSVHETADRIDLLQPGETYTLNNYLYASRQLGELTIRNVCEALADDSRQSDIEYQV